MPLSTKLVKDSIIAPSAKICELEGAIIMPLQRKSSPVKILGGVAHDDMPQCFHQYRGNKIGAKKRQLDLATDLASLAEIPNLRKQKKGTFLYGGPIVNHYGHFLAECIHRLWAMEYLEESKGVQVDGVVFLPRRLKTTNWLSSLTFKLPSIFMQTLEYLGLPKKKIKFQFLPMRIERLYVPEQASFFRPLIPINDTYKGFLSRCEQRNNIARDYSLPKKVYVSRTNFKLRGAYAGESYIEAFFTCKGFKVFCPEKYSLVEQLNVYKSAEEIVFAEGGALHILELLSEIKAKVTVIGRRSRCAKVYGELLEARTLDYHFFTSVITLPSLFIPKGSSKGAHGSALSALDTQRLVFFFEDELKLDSFDTTQFETSVKDDIEYYRKHYESTSVAEPAVLRAALEEYDKFIAKIS